MAILAMGKGGDHGQPRCGCGGADACAALKGDLSGHVGDFFMGRMPMLLWREAFRVMSAISRLSCKVLLGRELCWEYGWCGVIFWEISLAK